MIDFFRDLLIFCIIGFSIGIIIKKIEAIIEINKAIKILENLKELEEKEENVTPHNT